MDDDKIIYIENVSREEQWIFDGNAGGTQRIAVGALAKVTEKQAAQLLESAPAVWRRVPVISLGPPVG